MTYRGLIFKKVPYSNYVVQIGRQGYPGAKPIGYQFAGKEILGPLIFHRSLALPSFSSSTPKYCNNGFHLL